jgi:hypothetical protein
VVHNQLRITGNPYYLAISVDKDGEGHPVPTSLTNLEVQNEIQRASPIIYNSAYRQARIAAFFRYMKESCGAEWERSADGLLGNATIRTITVRMPGVELYR